MIFMSRHIHQKAEMALPGCMPIQAISYTLYSSSSNNDNLILGKRLIEFTNIRPTFEQYYRILLGKLTVPTKYVMAP